MQMYVVSAAALLIGTSSVTLAGAPSVTEEVVYVQSPTDTDGDGKPDRIYVRIDRTTGATNLPSIIQISPYAQGGNQAPDHNVDVSRLPQDAAAMQLLAGPFSDPVFKAEMTAGQLAKDIASTAVARGYAMLSVHSVGTGNSTGCPTVGDMSETLAGKAVIDWLNGRAKAVNSNGTEVKAGWSNGDAGMMGVSYNGTLPNMIATTGVEGLKAIVPIAAISSWYDYYRANGLVVGPGGYIGEDADVLGKFIIRPSGCPNTVKQIGKVMGREHGDFHQFWSDRDYVVRAGGVTAAVFIIHGQSDWNVKQRHAIRWWEALEGKVPLKMWLHKGGHGEGGRSDTMAQIYAWFDRYVKGTNNGIDAAAPIEVESLSGGWKAQEQWPHESTAKKIFYLNDGNTLSATPAGAVAKKFTDAGKTKRLGDLIGDPTAATANRLTFLTAPLAKATMLSGTSHLSLNVAVMNRRAANITIAVIEYKANGNKSIVTRGWVDPQNYADVAQGEKLVPGQHYKLQFDIEPKQYTFAAGSRIGVIIAGTDYDYTIRPDNGTDVSVMLGQDSSIEMYLSGE